MTRQERGPAADDWRPLGDRPSRVRWLSALLLVALACAAVALEVLCCPFRQWTATHPVSVTLAAGSVVVVFTALVVERVIATIEGRRWRLPSLLAVDAYVYSGDRAAQRIRRRVRDEVYALPSPPARTWPFRFCTALEMLVEQERERLDGISEIVREETDALAVIAMQVGSVTSRSDRFAGVLVRIFEQQDRLGRLAQLVHHLLFLGAGFSGPKGQALRDRAAATASDAEDLVQAFLAELAALRLAVAEERGA